MSRRATLLPILLLAACSGSTTDGGSGGVPADQFVVRFVDAVCDNVGSCCQAAGLAYDPAQCKAMGTAELGQEFEPNVPPNVKYDGTAAANCIDAVRAAAKSCGAFDLEDDPACQGIFEGTLPPGATCTRDYECADGATDDAYCETLGADQPGVCTIESAERGKLGDACGSTCTDDGSGTSCGSSSSSTGSASCFTNDGLYCDQTCKPLIAVGQPCTASESCVAGAYCIESSCTPLPSAGQPCALGFLCGENLYCNTAGNCEAPKPEGASCSSPSECATDFCRDGICAKDTIVSSEVCSGTP